MIRIYGPKDIVPSDAIDVTSASRSWGRKLSPFILGPVVLYGKHVSENVENAWQFSKVYQCHVDDNENLNKEYLEWSQSGWGKKLAVRYPMGKGAKPLYSYWDGEKLGYIEARKKIYVTLYVKAAFKTKAFELLMKEYFSRKDISLFDFDGYDHLSLDMTFDDVLHCEERKMGHAFVLAMMLGNLKK